MNNLSVKISLFFKGSGEYKPTITETYTTRVILAFIVYLVAFQYALCAESIASHFRISPKLDNGSQFMSIRLIGVLQLANVSPGGIKISELSGLAWDNDEQVLHAVSDQGYLLHLEPIFKNGIIDDILLSGKHALLGKSGKPLHGDNADSEGMDIINSNNNIRGDSELIISFERNPRIERYSPQGVLLGYYALPPELASIKNYQHKNKALESVTLHPEYGIVTVSERPLKHDGAFTLFSLGGDTWTYTPLDPDASAITSIAIDANGDFIILERIYSGLLSTFSIAIRQLLFSGRVDKPEIKTLALLKQDDGFLIDNFEGLTPHTGKRFFMVSDDNNSMFQKTLLMYFEILEQN
jgi:hypothetical protein